MRSVGEILELTKAVTVSPKQHLPKSKPGETVPFAL
jgi:hypothetical protein